MADHALNIQAMHHHTMYHQPMHQRAVPHHALHHQPMPILDMSLEEEAPHVR
jgi:hypothetical protein